MSDQTQIDVTIRTTKAGWDHIVQLIKNDNDLLWSTFDNACIAIIENSVAQSTPLEVEEQEPEYDDPADYDDDTVPDEKPSWADLYDPNDAYCDFGIGDDDAYAGYIDDVFG